MVRGAGTGRRKTCFGTLGTLMDRNGLPLTPPPGDVPPDPPRGFMARFRNYFLTGLIVAGPIAPKTQIFGCSSDLEP